jgi:hypothetical protein
MIEISSTEKAIMGLFEDHVSASVSEESLHSLLMQNNLLLETVATALQAQMTQERTSLHEYEKGYHKRHADLVNQVRGAEKFVKKAGKKSATELQSVGGATACVAGSDMLFRLSKDSLTR